MATDSIPQKRCSRCKQFFHATTEYFPPDKKMRSGLKSYCRECSRWYAREHGKRNAEKKREYQRNYRIEHPDRVRESQKRWSEKNVDYRREYNKQYFPDYHKHNYEYIRERQKRYNASHRDTLKANRQKRRNRELVSNNGFTTADWKRALEYFDRKCAVCGQPETFWTILAADHWTPLSKGGLTDPQNIIPLCHAMPGCPAGEPSCNLGKGDKYPHEWLEQIYGKRKASNILRRIQAYFDWLKSLKA